MIRTASILLAVLMLQTSCSKHQQNENQKLDNYFQSHMEKADLIGLQVASISNGELVWQGSYGLKNMETGTAVNDSTLFQIASVSKTVTSLGIMLLYDRGQLDLDEDVSSYLPFEIRNPHFSALPISLRMLLTHTSSMRDNWEIYDTLYTLPAGGDSPIELGPFVRQYFEEGGIYYHPDSNFANEKPGSSHAYCNMGYATLGVIIEEVSGLSFPEFMRKEIFKPLGMHNSYWQLKDIPHSNIASPHRILPSPKDDPHEPEVLNHYGYPS